VSNDFLKANHLEKKVQQDLGRVDQQQGKEAARRGIMTISSQLQKNARKKEMRVWSWVGRSGVDTCG